MKHKFFKFLTPILLFVGLGISPNAWAYNFKNPYIYFNNADLNWNPAMLFVGHSTYSAGYNQTSNPLADTKLVYFHPDANWGDQTEFTIGNTSNWGAETNSFDSRVGYMTHIGIQKNYGFDENNTYYVTGTAGNSPTINVSYCSGGHSALPKKNATSAVKVRTSSSASYTKATGTWPAKINLKGTYMSGNGTTARSTISSTAGNSQESDRIYGVVITGKVSMSYENLSNDYTFDGWGESTPSNTADYYITDDKTIYAFFTAKHTVTFDTPGNGSLGAKISSTSISSGTKQADGSKIVFTATPSTGYEVEGWYSNSTCTSQIAGTGTETTYTINSLTADATVYVKFKESNYSITYTPSPAVNFTYTTAPPNADYNSNVAMEFTPDANYVIASVSAYKTGASSTAVTVTKTDDTHYSFTQPAYNVTVHVEASLSTVKVTYGEIGNGSIIGKIDGDNIGDSPADVPGGSTVVFTATPDANYTVEGWYNNIDCEDGELQKGDNTGNPQTYTIENIAEARTVYVKFKETDYTITLSNGTGISAIKVEGTTQTSVTAHVATQTATITADVANGYTWSKWTTSGSITATPNLNTNGIQINATADGTLTATATPKTYTVSFDNNGGTGGQTGTVTATYDQPMPGNVTCPTRFGYEFQGYYYNNTQYYNANGASATAWNIDQNNITLTAKWTELECYMEGRFHIRATKDGAWVEVAGLGSNYWSEISKTIKFTLDEENKYYKLETNLPMYDLSYTLGGTENYQYFSIKQVLKDADISTAKEYMQNENCYFTPSMAGIENAKSWGVKDGTYKHRPHFGNEDKSGYVTIYFNETKLWFEIEPATLHNVTITTYGGGSVNPRGTYQIGPFQWDISATADYGYKFDGWTVSGDIQVDNINNPYAKIAATGDGTISANFKQLANIYFQTNGDWGENPVYIYFYKNNYYDDAKGSGSQSKNGCIWGPAIMNYTGANSIHRYPLDIDDLTNLGWNGHVAFTPDNQNESENFFDTKVVYCNSFDFCDNNNMIKATTWQKDLNKSGDKHASYYNYEKVHADGAPSSYYILFESENWKEKDENMFQDAKGYTVIKHYEAEANDEFRFRQNCGEYWGCNNTPVVGENIRNWSINKGQGNLAIHPWMSGDYEFKFDVMNHTLNVTYLGDIIISNFPGEISGFVNRSIKISPEVRLRNTQQKDVTIKFNETDGTLETELATYQQSGTNIVIVGKKTGSETIAIQYRNTRGYIVNYSLKVNVAEPIVIQAELTEGDTKWTNTGLVHIHFWGTSADKSQDAQMTYNETDNVYSVTVPKILGSNDQFNFIIWYGESLSMLGSDNAKWRQTDNIATSENTCYTMGAYTKDNEYRVATPKAGGGLCESGAYQIEVSMKNGNTYLSNIVTTESESKTFSFFAPKDGDNTYKGGTVRLLKDGAVVKTLTGFSAAGVYVADLNENDITTPELYNGDYYVIAGVSGSELNDDTKMHKFTPRENTTEDYSYYWTKYTGNCTDKNVIAKVANEYNSNLSLTIGADALTQADGKVEAGNVRFSYEPTTNAFKRAILGASNSDDFLNVYGNNVYADAAATQLLDKNQSLNLSKFADNSDWVYEKVVYVKVDNEESESKVTLKSVFNGQTSHLLGYEIDETTGEEKKDSPNQLTVLGKGSTTSASAYAIRISYDFKKNRLISSWEPTGGTYDSDMSINSDVLFIRTEDGDVQQVQVGVKDGTESYKISSLQHVMFVMEIDGSTDKESYSQYWISLPFDCQISDIFGVEGYITLDENRIAQKGTWGIMRYRGDIRAQKGWFLETDGFWEWMYEDEIMNAGEGYVLFFERESIKDWPTIKVGDEEKTLKRLYFPSKDAGFVMSNTVDAEHSQFECKSMRCTIKTPEDREAYDSNWRVIGPKSYNNIKAQAVVDDNPYGEQTKFPNFLYTYDVNAETGHKYIAHDGKEYSYQSFHAYMVQYEGTITWVPYTQTTPATVAAHYVEDSNFKGGTLTIELMQNNEQLDRAFVKLDEKGTVGYDFSQDLTKITESCSQIASVSEDVLYAGSTLPLDIELVPLNVKVTANGTYDIALKKSLKGLEVNLFDAFEQTTTPLDMMSATVTLNKGEYKDRFYLQLKQKSGETPTSFEGKIEQYNLPTDKTQKLLINGNIYLINGGRVYNATGVQLR